MIEVSIVEVLFQEAEFPELVSDVLADISHRSIRAHDDFVVIVTFGVDSHHPAAFVFTFVFEEDRVPRLQLLEGVLPEFQMQNVAFAGEQVVVDRDAPHGLQMTVDDRHRDE